MIAFVVSSFLFTAFFLIVLTAEPISTNYLSRFQYRWIANIRKWRHTGLCLLLFALIAPFVLLCVIAGQIHPRYSAVESVFDFIFSPSFASAIIGFVFSGIFVIWLHQVYRLTNTDKVTPLLYMETTFLILLILIGCSDVSGPVISRISGFKVPGAELSFFQPTRAPPDADPSAVDLISGKVSVNVGLTGLHDMAKFISRDVGYVELSDGYGSTTNDTDTLEFMMSNTFSALAACQSVTYADTQDLQSTKRQAGRLMSAIRSYQEALYFKEKTPKDSSYDTFVEETANSLSNEFADAAATALHEGLPLAFPPSLSSLTDTMQIHDVDTRVSHSQKCLELIYSACLDQNKTKEDRLPNSKRDSYCATVHHMKCRSNRNQPDCHIEDQSLPATQKIIDDYRSYIKSRLPIMLQETFSRDPNNQQRPYLSLIYAYMAALAEEPDAAGAELNDWLASHASPERKGYGWYNARVLTTLVNIAEEAVRRQGRITRVMQSYLIRSYLRAIEAESLSFISKGLSRFNWKTDNISGTSFKIDNYDSGSCTRPDDISDATSDLQLKAAFTKITTTSNFIDRALDDPDYLVSYSPQVHQFLGALSQIDFSCLAPIFQSDWRNQATLYHAEILRLHAKRILVEAAVLAQSEDPVTLRRSLQGGVKAAESAMRQLRDARAEAINSRQSAKTYAQQTASSDAEDIYSRAQIELLQLQRRLEVP